VLLGFKLTKRLQRKQERKWIMITIGLFVALTASVSLSNQWSKFAATKTPPTPAAQTPAPPTAPPTPAATTPCDSCFVPPTPAKSIEGNEKVLPYDIVAINRRLVALLKESRRDPLFFNKSLPMKAALEESTGVEVTNSPIKLAKQMQENIEMGFPFLVLPAYGNNYDKQQDILDKCVATEACSESGEGKDVRSFGFERWSTDADQFSSDTLLGTTIANLEALYGYAFNGKEKQNMVLAGVIKADPRSNPSSGGGWHVDDASCLRTGWPECKVKPNSIKMMMLLSDVTTDHGTASPPSLHCLRVTLLSLPEGPFCMLINKGHWNSLQHKPDARQRTSRFADEELTRYLRANEDAFVLEFVAPAGTVILFETQHVHRGKAIETGVRKTLTVYVNKVFPIKYDATKACKAEL
jgi:hypothetical protein